MLAAELSLVTKLAHKALTNAHGGAKLVAKLTLTVKLAYKCFANARGEASGKALSASSPNKARRLKEKPEG